MKPPRRTLLSAVALLCAISVAGAASAGRTGHRFSATYAGRGQGQTSATTASGTATMSGRANLLGQGTLRGSGHGTFTSQTCLTFSGRATLSGTEGSLRLVAHRAHACATGGGNIVAFSGTATVTSGTARMAGARGRLSFRGSFNRATGAVRITLAGRIRLGG